MRKLLSLTCLLFFVPQAAFAAIAFDNSTSAVQGAATALTAASFAVAATNPIIFVCVSVNRTTEALTSVTFNGVSMTQVAKKQGNPNIFTYLYYITGQSGTHNVVANISPATDARMVVTSYTGASQVSGLNALDASTTNTATATSITTSLTTIADNSWMVSCLYDDTNDPATPASTGITQRVHGSLTWLGDSGSAITPAGSYSMTWNPATSDVMQVLQASFAPAAVAATPVYDNTDLLLFNVIWEKATDFLHRFV